MKSRQKTALEKLLSQSFPIFKWVMTLLLILSLTSCTEKAGSQEVSIDNQKTASQISQVCRQFSETAPPEVIQELRPILELYQPLVTIMTPTADEVIEDNTITVRFQVTDLPIFKDPQWQLGPHVHVIIDNEPYIAVYDLNQPLVLSDLSVGTHTLRVFASRPWHESFKNEGAYTQIRFHIFTKTDDNNPASNLPLLTYSSPNASYGAEPIMLDFYLTNAPLHIAAEDNPDDTISDWRIRCTINGESFILDRWQSVYLKGFTPGKNWVKLEFLDNQGNPVKNVFNSTARLINYEPKGKDSLSRIVRGELTANEVRGIVDPNYTTKIPVTKPTPTVTPKLEVSPTPQPQVGKPPTPEIEVSPTPQAQVEKPPTPEVEVSPTPQPQVEKPPTPEVEVSPTPQPQVEKPPTPEIEVSPTPQAQVEKPPTPEIEVSPTPQAQVEKPPTPEIEVSPTPQAQVEKPPTPEIEVSPTPQIQPAPEPQETPSPIESIQKDQSKLEKTGLR
ncbi:hypothetical protein [Trichormus azollae]|uniref:FHA domain containing protein n=1 Tax=Nostoc azollae (strain 0708) TaxID=551115 RepID=D7E0E3_NOSA0|nr:hypothetical protein [Trichormus azollae]ADI63052.1 conserved hypothetical protein ['Nostoc azollae' 0708]